MDPALEQFCKKNNINYLGYKIIKFENTTPDDGKIFIDDVEIKKEDFLKLFEQFQKKDV